MWTANGIGIARVRKPERITDVLYVQLYAKDCIYLSWENRNYYLWLVASLKDFSWICHFYNILGCLKPLSEVVILSKEKANRK